MLQLARWRTILILGTVVLGVLLSLPNFLSKNFLDQLPSWVPKPAVVLGLDLQGGAYLLYQVDRADYIDKRLRNLVGDVRRELLKADRINYTGLAISGQSVQVRITDPARYDEARRRLETLRNPLNDSLLGGSSVYEFDLSTAGEGVIRLTYSQNGLTQRMRGLSQQSVEVINKRVDAIGTREASVQRQGEDRILVEAPGLQDPQRLKAIVGQTAQLTFHLVRSTTSSDQATREAGSIVLPDAAQAGISYVLEESPLMTGLDLNSAQAGFDQRNNEPVVNFSLTAGGARKFGLVTQQNVGRQFAIVLDDKVLSAPVIREPILGGSGQISGSFTVQTANDLAVLLRAGALPAKLTIVEERTIGPSLGEDSIRAGIIAVIVATAAIALFMIVSYGLLGVFAVIALIAQNFLLLAIMSVLGATLTLPGIAGIVLTMGMAVDANVLIYERMREEAHAGRGVIAALDTGFTKALATIIDAHLTAFIAAIALFALGSGPIKGFAVALAIGIFSTLFTAYLVTRLIVAIWVKTARPKVVPL